MSNSGVYGVVPLQAAYAWSVLRARFGDSPC